MTKHFYPQPFLSYLSYLVSFMFFISPVRTGDSFFISFLFLCLCAGISHFTFQKLFSKTPLKKGSALFFVPAFLIIFLTCFFMYRLSYCYALFSGYYSKGVQGFLFCITAFILCAYSSSKKPSGILNFSSFSGYILLAFFIFLFFTIKKITPNIEFFPALKFENFKYFKTILFEGVFIFLDIGVFHFISSKNCSLLCEKDKESYRFSQNIALLMFIPTLFINSVRNINSFGNLLLKSLDFPELCAIKLVPHFHFPEIYLFIIGLCAFIKISSYFYVSSYLFDLSRKNLKSTISKSSTFLSGFIGIFLFIVSSRIFDNYFFDIHSPIFCALCIFCIIFFYVLSFFFSKKQNIS